MGDWRWVTEVVVTQLGGVTYPERRGQWVNFDAVDIVRPLEGARFHHAQTLLIGMEPINRMMIAEQIDPTVSGEQQQPTTDERTTHADSAMEPTDPT